MMAAVANDDRTAIWLEVGNVRIKGTTLSVQLRADREPDRPRWWDVSPSPDLNTFKAIIEALDKKRPVMAKLNTAGSNLGVSELMIQYVETTTTR